EPRAERPVVGLYLDLPELVGLRDEAQLVDVELLAHELGDPLDRLTLGAGSHDGRRPPRLSDLGLGLRAGGEPEPDGLARDRHRLLELEVAPTGSGEVAQVHARLAPVQVVV